jgi:acyl carrier protein
MMSVNDPSLVRRVREIVAKVLGVEIEAVELGARIDQIADTDSLSLAEIASGLDDGFSIRVPTAEMIEATTIADLVALVQTLVESREASRSQ